jgi:hypothetical protein
MSASAFHCSFHAGHRIQLYPVPEADPIAASRRLILADVDDVSTTGFWSEIAFSP